MQIPINVKINDQDRQIIIENDPSWGKTQILLQSSLVSDGKGGQRVDMNTFFNKILELVIVEGFDEVKDKSKLLQLPTSEVTQILGEILRIIPLQKYLDNLGMAKDNILSL